MELSFIPTGSQAVPDWPASRSSRGLIRNRGLLPVGRRGSPSYRARPACLPGVEWPAGQRVGMVSLWLWLLAHSGGNHLSFAVLLPGKVEAAEKRRLASRGLSFSVPGAVFALSTRISPFPSPSWVTRPSVSPASW